MNRLLALFVFFVFSSATAQVDDKQLLAEVREKMPQAFNDEKACAYLLKKCKPVVNPETVLKGYIGGLHIAQSKHAPLFDKMSALNTGTELLEAALKEKPDNIELRFLRMTIQLNLPSFLNYNDNVESDKKFVLKHYQTAMPVLKDRIINFIKTSGHFSDAEIKQIAD
jgi:hypothetical protein